MLALGTQAPDFDLTDVTSGKAVSRAALAGHPLLVLFVCNHCPYVVHMEEELARFAADYAGTDLAIVAVNSNVAAHERDTPEHMREQISRAGWTFPYLTDEDQSVARAYTAACTPDNFLFDAEHKLVYRGQLDSSRPGSEEPVTFADLRAAVDAVLAGSEVPAEQRPSMGCGIKWLHNMG